MLILTLATLFSLSIAGIWINYLRKIDLFENEYKWHIVLVFILGATFPFLIEVLHNFVYKPLQIHQSGNLLYDSAFFVFGVGLPEELLKFLPAFILIKFTNKAGNEPLDYVLFACVSALGFAFHENILYVRDYGLGVLTSRSILSVPAHMFFSAMFMYGIVLSRFHNTRLGKLNIPLFILLAIVSHGFYDFWLSVELANIGVLITILYFLLTISVFITILNNCMNNSPFYTPKKIINSEKIALGLSLQYLIVLVAIILAVCFIQDYLTGMAIALYLVVFRVAILGILIIRLSRFKIVPGKWNKIKPELPFSIIIVTPAASYQGGSIRRGSLLRIKVKGESFNETYLNAFLEEHFELLPVSAKKTYIGQKRVAFMEKKLFLKNDETFYLLKVILEINPEKSVYYLLKAKTSGSSRTPQGYPIAALLKIKDPHKILDENSDLNDFPFLEWVILKPIKS